ncbi:glutathione S-transferase domain-containing protein [Trematosphaeria pertusa]|uniref:Glutathione S-transferase domain-containing protein n=1 Tax=Trematosphaeria pertusa TaxID=390896 RepID=A0A6A6IAG6_9PLEO|nr:glutathione S-transferase domain-containing protein [Trematosphaeria pertusa]KAF2247396.1 glutathione S-transferase domain-containing protein [Trematosphaeria pertusa]
MHLYDSTIPSGNAYKVQLLLAHLKISYQTTSLNIVATPSETRTESFLKLNPNGRIPVLVLDDGTPLAESNAILFYLAEETPFLPSDRLARAQVLQWLFFEQYSHEPYLAVWKFQTYWGDISRLAESEVKKLKEKGQAAIDVMERHLEGREWFVSEQFSIADVALYAYTCAAEAVGFSVGENVRAWLARVESVEGHVRIRKDPTGKCPL